MPKSGVCEGEGRIDSQANGNLNRTKKALNHKFPFKLFKLTLLTFESNQGIPSDWRGLWVKENEQKMRFLFFVAASIRKRAALASSVSQNKGARGAETRKKPDFCPLHLFEDIKSENTIKAPSLVFRRAYKVNFTDFVKYPLFPPLFFLIKV